MNEKAMIEFRNVTFRYPSEDTEETRPVLQGLDLTIRPGEFVAILGRNGSGKSTIAKLANGILEPDEGEISILGLDSAREENHREIRRNCGLVFQNPDNQIVATIVEEDVAFGPENLGVLPREIRERVDAALRAVGMYEYRRREPHKLSGGQKQRVAIAGILAMDPRCIILDEATAMLDPHGRREVMETVRRLNRERGITIVYITHFMEEAAEADRVIVMDGGRAVMDDDPHTVFSQIDRMKELGLDVPQVSELMAYLGRHGVRTNGAVLNAEECIESLSQLLEEA